MRNLMRRINITRRVALSSVRSLSHTSGEEYGLEKSKLILLKIKKRNNKLLFSHVKYIEEK